jgi:hypothetical protein
MYKYLCKHKFKSHYLYILKHCFWCTFRIIRPLFNIKVSLYHYKLLLFYYYKMFLSMIMLLVLTSTFLKSTMLFLWEFYGCSTFVWAFDPFWNNFCMWYKGSIQLHCFAHGYPLFPTPFVEKFVLSPWNGSDALVKNDCSHRQEFTSELSFLHWSLYLSLCYIIWFWLL